MSGPGGCLEAGMWQGHRVAPEAGLSSALWLLPGSRPWDTPWTQLLCCEEAQTRPFGETVWRGAEAPPTIAVTPSPALMSFSAVPNPVEPSVSLGSAMSS